MQESKLLGFKNCPFCGTTPFCTKQIAIDPIRWIVECDGVEGCGITGPLRRTAEAAIAAWNTRPPAQDREKALLELLRQVRPYVRGGQVVESIIYEIDAALAVPGCAEGLDGAGGRG